MYVTDLRRLRIISLASALRMGQVEDALLDPACSYVAALRVRTLQGGPQRLVLREAVRHVGRHAVILNGAEELPDETLLANADRMVGLRTLLRLDVVSDEGNLIGQVRNAIINPATLAIVAYEVVRSPLERALRVRAPRLLDAHEALSGSKDVLIVPEAAVQAGAGTLAALEAGLPPPPRWQPVELPVELPDGRDGASAALG
jgi:sporulation protein YlmC with PRC-barrel domain